VIVRAEENGSYCLMGTVAQFGKMKKFMELDGGDD
jgi:hypothetical protein